MAARVRINEAAIASVVAKADREARRLAEEILEDAQALAPVRTGHLKESGYVEKKRPGTYVVGFSAPYARFVEFGHRTSSGTFVDPQPFLTPAAFKRRR